MSSLFRQPIKDELLWGAITRLKARFPTIGNTEIRDLLFGGHGTVVGRLFPSYIGSYCESLAHQQKPTPAMVLAENTMFPFVAPFLDPLKSQALNANMVGNDSLKGKLPTLGYAALEFNAASPLRFCQLCLEADIREVGFSVWRCVHQIWPLKICPYHECDLVDTRVLRMDNAYVAIEDAAEHIPAISTSYVSPLQTAFAKNVLELQSNSDWEIGPDKLREACRIELRKGGLKTRGASAYTDFKAELLRRFGADALGRCFAGIDGKQRTWGSPIFYHSRHPSPLLSHHCNVICALVGFQSGGCLKPRHPSTERNLGHGFVYP